MLALIANILHHPRQILRPETHDAVPGLPFEHFLGESELMIDVVRRSTFQLTDERAGHERWRDRHGDVDVSRSAADFVDENIALIAGAL